VESRSGRQRSGLLRICRYQDHPTTPPARSTEVLEALMSALTSVRPDADRLPHPVLRATAWSSMIGLVAGLVLGVVTQAQEHDGR
jgi:hypothetical protein